MLFREVRIDLQRPQPTADHHRLVGGALTVGENGVPMVRHARDYSRLAGTADALLAGILDVEPRVAQHLEDRLSRRDDEFLAGGLKLHDESALKVRRFPGDDAFDESLVSSLSATGRA